MYEIFFHYSLVVSLAEFAVNASEYASAEYFVCDAFVILSAVSVTVLLVKTV
jgi:hypothetical protein